MRSRSSQLRSWLRAALWVLVGPSVVVGALLTVVFGVAMLAVLTQLLAVFLRSVGYVRCARPARPRRSASTRSPTALRLTHAGGLVRARRSLTVVSSGRWSAPDVGPTGARRIAPGLARPRRARGPVTPSASTQRAGADAWRFRSRQDA